MAKDKKPVNPQAFPVVLPPDKIKGWDAEQIPGMTLRDYFAAKAMQSIMDQPIIKLDSTTNDTFEILAIHSYQVADAMLKERENNSNN